MNRSSIFEGISINKEPSKNPTKTVSNKHNNLLLNSDNDYPGKRFPLRIKNFSSNEDDYLYDLSTNAYEVKISKKDMMEFSERVDRNRLRNSGIILPMEKVTPPEVHAKQVRHNDVRWGDTICIANVISPHLIFVKRQTSTYKNFQFTLPDNLEEIEWIDSDEERLDDPRCLNLRDCVGYYVLAPLIENVYVRARIIDISGDKVYVKVIYIDHGTISWLNRSSLAVMEQDLFKFRWQVRPIALYNIYPYSSNKESPKNVLWSHEHIQALKDVLSNHSVLNFTHYNRLKRVYAADIVPVELFPCENDLTSQYSTSINEILIKKYSHLFYRKEFCNEITSNVLIDISDDCDEKLDIKEMPTWKLTFPPLEKINKQSNDCIFTREDGIIGFSPDFWTVKKMKDQHYITNSGCVCVFLQAPMDDSHPLRLGGYLISTDEIEKLREKARNERKIGSGQVQVKRLLSELCHEVRINAYEKIRRYSEQYKNFNKNASIKIDDIITEWQNNRPFYIVTERMSRNNELMFFRAEVTGFHEEVNYFLLRIRYLDFNGTGICCMHEAYKLSKYLADDMPYNIGFSYYDILVKNEAIFGEDKDFIGLVCDVSKNLSFSEPTIIRLNLINDKESYPNINKHSNYPLVVDSIFQTDFDVKEMWRIKDLDKDGNFVMDPVDFDTIIQKYENCFEKKASFLKSAVEFYTRDNFTKFKNPSTEEKDNN